MLHFAGAFGTAQAFPPFRRRFAGLTCTTAPVVRHLSVRRQL